MVVFHFRSSLIEGCRPLKVVFHQRPSSFKDPLPSKSKPVVEFLLVDFGGVLVVALVVTVKS